MKPEGAATPTVLCLVICAGTLLLACNPATRERTQQEQAAGFLAATGVSAAFTDAIGDPGLWERARNDGPGFLRTRGVDVPSHLRVDFLEARREGSWIKYTGREGEAVLDMYCPPDRLWWAQLIECRKVIRACEKKAVALPTGRTVMTREGLKQETHIEQIDANCYFVCDNTPSPKELAATLRPWPWPPLPRP